MNVQLVNKKISSKDLFKGVDFKNEYDFYTFKINLNRFNKSLTEAKIKNILAFLKEEYAVYCDADLKDMTKDEVDTLIDLIFK
ncbi:hypothetical protein [Senegalia massiliensis]|uniref:hypothetical protein n=1 Tax=Senegalia massiliensis TaxID=1720316 RepID=UPI0010301860|nr:hypothetical protein [Senegalia massiliensis]